MDTRTPVRGPSVHGAASRLGRGILLVIGLAGVPWALVTQAPVPLPSLARLRELGSESGSDPGSAAAIFKGLGRLLQEPITDDLIIRLLAITVWLIWVAFVLCVLTEAGSLAAGIQAPHLPGLGGMQTAASWLLTGTLAGLLASSAVISHQPTTSATPAQTLVATTLPATDLSSHPRTHTGWQPVRQGTGHSGAGDGAGQQQQEAGDTPIYVVQQDDWLGAIAHRFLGGYNDYPQLQRANDGLIPSSAGPHGPDHIVPGWRLLLPPGSRDRGPENHATGKTIARHIDPRTGRISTSDRTIDDERAHTDPVPTATATPAGGQIPGSTISPPPEPSRAPTVSVQATATSEPHAGGEGIRDRAQDDADGVHVGEGWISWPLASSLAAMAALVWLARRRRYRYTEPFFYPKHPADPNDPDDDMTASGYREWMPDPEFDEELYRPDGSTGDADPGDDGSWIAVTDTDETPLYRPARHAAAGTQTPDGETDLGQVDDLDSGAELGAHPDEDSGQREQVSRRARRMSRAVRRSRAEPEEDADLQPMPAALNRIRLLVRAHGDALAGHLPVVSPVHSQDAAFATGHQDAASMPDESAGVPSVLDPERRDPGTEVAGLPPVGPSGAQLAGVPVIPPEGLGLTGPGAAGLARALLVASLSAGSPTDPDAAGTVVTTSGTLSALIGGTAAVDVTGLPRLQVTPDLDSALSIIDEHILSRRRLLDEHDATDVLQLREDQPWSEPMPPVLLLAQAPSASDGPIKARLSTSLHLGAPLQISGAMLGDWPRGQALVIETTGDTAPLASTDDRSGPTVAHPGAAGLARLDTAATIDLLTVIGEAHTGHPISAPASIPTVPAGSRTTSPVSVQPDSPAASPPHEAPAVAASTLLPGTLEAPASSSPAQRNHQHQNQIDEDEQASQEHQRSEDPRQAPSSRPPAIAQEKIRLRVLGAPTILDPGGHPVPGMRSGAIQLMAILAVHRDGHRLMDIMEKMWPDAQTRRAADRLSTEAANLRRTVRIALGRPEDRTSATNAVINTGSFYILNPGLVDVDLWQLQDGVNAAKATDDPDTRIELLRAAIAAHTGHLAAGRDYPWADVARHQLQRHGIRARLHLAQLLASHDPAQAARIVTEAADLDPVSEDLAQRAIRASAAAGDADGVRARLRAVRSALDEIDQEPSSDTLDLAATIPIATPARLTVTSHARTGTNEKAAAAADSMTRTAVNHDRRDDG